MASSSATTTSGAASSCGRVAGLPYGALQSVFLFGCADARTAVSIHGTVCRNWRAILTVTDALWVRLLRQRWPGTAPAACSFALFLERTRRVCEDLAPIRAAQTTPIEDCELAFRCPMLVENLELVQPAPASGGTTDAAGPVYFCGVCSKHVFSVTTQAEKERRARRGECVVFYRRDVSVSARVRVKVALVYSARDVAAVAPDVASRAATAAAVSAVAVGDDDAVNVGLDKARRALRELRAAADAAGLTSTVAVRNRLMVNLQSRDVVEFRVVPRDQLYDPQAKRAHGAAHSVGGSPGQRTFVPDVVLYVDDEAVQSNFAPTIGAIGVRIGHTTATVAQMSSRDVAPTTVHHGGDARQQAPLDDDRTTPLALWCDAQSGEWHCGREALRRQGEDPALFVSDLVGLVAITSAQRLQDYVVAHPELATSATAAASGRYRVQLVTDNRSRDAVGADTFGVALEVVGADGDGRVVVARITGDEIGRLMFKILVGVLEQLLPVGYASGAMARAGVAKLPCIVTLPTSFQSMPAYDAVRQRVKDFADACGLKVLRTSTHASMTLQAASAIAAPQFRNRAIRAIHIHVGSSSFEATDVEIDEGVTECFATTPASQSR